MSKCVSAACAALLLAWAGASASPAEPNYALEYRVYVTNEMSGDLSVIDGSNHSIVATVPLGKRPRGVRASADGRTLYIALSGSPLAPPGTDESKLPPADKAADGIGIVDTAMLRLRRVLRGFSDPEQLAVSVDGRRIYVASEDTGMAVIADGRSGTVRARLAVGGEPEGVAISPGGRFAYVTSEEDNRVAVIDTSTEKIIARFAAGKRPRGVAFSPDGHIAYITGESDASLTLVNASTHQPLGTVSIPGQNARPMGVAVSPDGKRVFVSTGHGGTVVAIDTQTRQVLGTVAVGARPWGIAIAPDGRLLYTANGLSNDVSIVDAHTLQLLGKVAVGNRPWGIVIAR